MLRFVFVGPQGTFAVPAGESRIGSDAACQICIRGEGILPIHAYVRMDGEKLLIRPAEGGSGSAFGSGSILINGQPLSGPVALTGGQEVTIGTVQMRVLVDAAAQPPLISRIWSRRWVRGVAWTTASVLAVCLILALIVRFVILDEDALKKRLSDAVATHLLRDEVDMDPPEVRPFEGTIHLRNIKIKDRNRISLGPGELLIIPEAHLKFEPVAMLGWALGDRPWLGKFFRDYSGVRIDIKRPDLLIERSRTDGSLSIDDILQKLAAPKGPIELNVEKLDFVLNIEGGSIRLRDNYTNIGETSFEDINITLTQAALGEPLKIERCKMRVNSFPVPVRPGSLELSGELNLIDQSAVIDLNRLSSKALELKIVEFDLGRFFEHLGYAWEPYGTGFKVVLGKPISGAIHLWISDLKNIRIDGKVDSESLLSIKEKERPPLGNTPMGLEFDVLLCDSGHGYRPHEMQVRLKSGRTLSDPSSIHLHFAADGRLNPRGSSAYNVSLSCIMEEFFATDVGKRLGLDGRIGGRLQGLARLDQEPDGTWKIYANMETDNGYVMVSNNEDKGGATKTVRQPLPLSFSYNARAQPNQSGGVPDFLIDNFKVEASSFVATSEVPGVIKGLDRKGILDAKAQFKLHLKGRQFWLEFEPILALFGFTQPLEEIFDLKVTLFGSNDEIEIGAEGEARRQWDKDPSPVKLLTLLKYNRKATPAIPPESASPYLSVVLGVSSPQGQPLSVYVKTSCSRTERTETIISSFEGFDRERNLTFPGIRSDIATLRERFRPYIEGYLKSRDAALLPGQSGWLKFYKDTALTGYVEQSGRVTIERMLDSASPTPDKLTFDLTIDGRDLDVRTRFSHLEALLDPKAAAKPKSADGKPVDDPVWLWKEAQPVKLALQGSYAQRLRDDKEEQDIKKLNIEKLDVKGSVGQFRLSLNDLDMYKLQNLRSFQNQTWTDCLNGMKISGQINAPAYQLAQSLHILPADHPLSGTLALEVGFDRQKDSLDFSLMQKDRSKNSFLASMDLSGSLLHLRELSARLLPFGDATPWSKRVSAYVKEGGPATLLYHLGDDLSVNALQVEMAPFVEWLSKDYKNAADAPEPLAAVLRGEWKPQGIWRAAGMKLSRTDAKVSKWQLYGALRNDLQVFGDADAAGNRPARGSFTNEWALRLGLSVLPDNTLGIHGDAILDQVAINASLPEIKYNYVKPAGEACKLELEQCLYSHGILAQIMKLKLLGKPVALEMKNFEAGLSADKQSLEIAELIVDGGPMRCVVVLQKYEPSADRLQGRIHAVTADAAYLASLLPLPAGVSASGTLKDFSFAYRGSLIGLQAMVQDPAQLAQRMKIPATDARLVGLNPEHDTLEFEAKPAPLVIKRLGENNQTSELTVSGEMKLSARDLNFKTLSATIVTGRDAEAKTTTFSSPALQISSVDPKLNLTRAFAASGTPLHISGDIASTTAIEPLALVSAFKLMRNGKLEKDLRSPRTLPENLILTGTLTAPSMLLNETKFEPFEAQNLVLKNRKLVIGSLSTTAMGGRFSLNDANLDLNNSALSMPGQSLNIKDVEFKAPVKLLEADLATLPGVRSGKQAYALSGRMDAQGKIDGFNFSGTDRLRWDGAVKLKMQLALQAPKSDGARPPAELVAPWSRAFTGMGAQMFIAFVRAAGDESSNIHQLSFDLPEPPAAMQGNASGETHKMFNGAMLALQAYLARTAGVDFDRLEFEPFTPTVVIEKGFAKIETFKLLGRGSSQGLEITIRNVKINLADEAFADEAQIHVSAIPKAARERLGLEKWPADVRDEFMLALEEGKLALRVNGRLNAPVFKFPWLSLRSLGMRVLFNTEKINDLETLQKSREFCQKHWPAEQLDQAALLGDRFGVGLPMTVTSRIQGETIIDRIAGMPQSLQKLLTRTGPTITPRDALEQMLNPEPDPAPVVPPGTKSAPETPPKGDPKK